MKFSLYRKMSVIEGDKVLSKNAFEKPADIIYLPRKWFSTSALKTHYFKSPFYNGETMTVKVDINEDYYRRIFLDGEFLKKEPNGFYGYTESQNDILYAKSHKTLDSFYNIGFLDLETFNQQFDEVTILDEDTYYDYLEKNTLGASLNSFVVDEGISDNLDFYFQTGTDVSTLCFKYQTIMPEGIDPIIKKIHFDKDLNRLRKNNLNKFPVTLLVRFNRAFKKYSKYNEFGFSLNTDEIIKFSNFIDSIKVVEIEKMRTDGKIFIQIPGDNLYIKHDKKGEPRFNRLSFEDFETVSALLFEKNFKIDDILCFIPNLKDLDGINQVDPRHIDNLRTHIEKTINMSNLTINYFKDQGMQFDAETLIYLKWVLLFHDLGKPYCECLNITSRYSQFGEKDKYRNIIIDQVLDSDIAFPAKQICKLFNASSLMQNRKIKNTIRPMICEIEEYYQVDEQEAYRYLNRFLNVAFLAKVSHSASLKTRAFATNYSDDLVFFDRVADTMIYLGDREYRFEYEDYFTDIMGAYEEIVEDFYLEKKHTTLENVRKMLKSDYKDLEFVYRLKLGHPHKIEDEGQYNYDELICAYFLKDNELLSKYFTGEILDKDKHGQIHSERVGIFSYLIGKLKGLCDEDIEILLLASKYHDIGRKVIDDDKTHSIESLKLMRKDNILTNSSIRDYVYYLVLAHGFRDSEDLNIIKEFNILEDRALNLLSIFKDADALDRVRYDTEKNHSSVLNVKYLRNDESRKLVKFSYMLNAQYKQNKRELSADVKKLLKN